jgi:cytochrome P450
MTRSLAVTPRFYQQFLLAKNPVRYCNEVRAKFGDLVLVRGFYDFYLINDPELVGLVLLNKEGIVDRVNPKNEIYKRIANIGRTGLATSGAQHWKGQRKRIAPLFGASAIRGFAETMRASAEHWADRWEARSRAGTPFNIKDEMNDLSLDVNTRCLFNTELAADHAHLQGWFSVMKRYLEAFPYPVVSEWWFPSPLNLKAKHAVRAFDRYAMSLVAERRANPLPPDSYDMVTRMLNARNAETGEGMTDEQICHEMLTFLIAGFESTSSALLWTFHALSQHPEVEERVHEELDAVIGQRSLALEDLPKLAYTKRVIDEVMRQRPASWFMSRTAARDITVGDVRIPNGSNILISIPTLHNNPSVWPNPERFDPDRFLPEAVAQRSPNSYVPFGRGPHSCIGIHFSLQELLIMTAVLCRRFRVVMAEDNFDADDVIAGVSVYPRRGIQMRIERRAHTQRKAA